MAGRPSEHERGDRHTPATRPVVLIFLARLVLSLSLLAGLYLDAREQPATSKRFSVAGCIARGGFFARVSPRRPPRLLVRVDRNGVHVEGTYDDLATAGGSLPRDPGGWTEWGANPHIHEIRRGLWALTDRIEKRSLIIFPQSRNAAWDAPPEVRAAAADWLCRDGWITPAHRDRLIAGDFMQRSSLPGGWVHTVIALALLAVALALFPWRQTARLAAAPFARRKPDPWLCEGCGYDLRGIHSPRCPECGEPAYVPPRVVGWSDRPAGTTER